MRNLISAALLAAFAASFANHGIAAERSVYGQAVTRFFAGEYDWSYQALSKLVDAGSNDPRVFYYRGLCALRLGRTDDANADIRAAAQCELAADMGDEVNRAIERIQGPTRIWLERHRRYARSRASLSNRGRDPSKALRSLYGDAFNAYRRGDWRRTVELCNQAIEAGTQDARIYYYRGLAYDRQGNVDAANDDFNQAARLEFANYSTPSVGRALERIQGPIRQSIEQIRLGAAAQAAESAADIAANSPNGANAPALPVARGLIPENSVPRAAPVEPAPMPVTPADPMPVVPTPAPAARNAVAAAPQTGAIDLSWLPPNTDLVVSVNVSELWAADILTPVRDSPQTQQGLGQMQAALGFGPEGIKSVVAGFAGVAELAAMAQPGAQPPAGLPEDMTKRFVAVITTHQPMDRDRLFQMAAANYSDFDANGVEYGGQTYYVVDEEDPVKGAPAVFFAAPNTYVFAEENMLKATIDAGPRAAALKLPFAKAGDHVFIAFVPEDFDALTANAPPPGDSVPPSVGALWNALNGNLNAAAIALRLTGNIDLRVMLDCTDPNASDEALTALEQLLAEGRFMFDATKGQLPQPLIEPVTEIVEGITADTSNTTLALNLTVPGSIKDAIMQTPQLMMPIMMGMAGSMQGGLGSALGGDASPSATPGATPAPAGTPAPVAVSEGITVAASATLAETFSFDNGQQKEVKLVQVNLDLVGDDAAKAVAWGAVEIKSASDGAGRDLNLRKTQFDDPTTSFSAIEREGFFASEHPENGARVTLQFDAPEGDDVKSVAALDGVVKLRIVDEAKDIVVDDIASFDGKPLDHPELAALGYGFDVAVKKEDFGGDPTTMIELTLSKVPDGLNRTQVVQQLIEGGGMGPQAPALLDGAGEVIENTQRSSGGGGDQFVSNVGVTGNLPAGAGLKLRIHTGVRLVGVPVSARDVAVTESTGF